MKRYTNYAVLIKTLCIIGINSNSQNFYVHQPQNSIIKILLKIWLSLFDNLLLRFFGLKFLFNKIFWGIIKNKIIIRAQPSNSINKRIVSKLLRVRSINLLLIFRRIAIPVERTQSVMWWWSFHLNFGNSKIKKFFQWNI